MNEPILGKAEPHGNDYKPMTWRVFLKLKECANEIVDRVGYPIYLVGSALHKEIPRDIDISIIVPLKEYEEKYGELPVDQKDYGEYLCNVVNANIEYFLALQDVLDWQYHIDFKVCSDSWFIEKPKLLLAKPQKIEII